MSETEALLLTMMFGVPAAVGLLAVGWVFGYHCGKVKTTTPYDCYWSRRALAAEEIAKHFEEGLRYVRNMQTSNAMLHREGAQRYLDSAPNTQQT